MAEKEIIVLVCDIGAEDDPSHRDDPETITFVVDGRRYEIEACSSHRGPFDGPLTDGNAAYRRKHIKDARLIGPAPVPAAVGA